MVKIKLESFEDFCNKEVIYRALRAVIVYIKHTHPQNEIITVLCDAQNHREGELREHYNSQLYRERDDGG